MSINDGNVDSYLKSNFNLGTEDDKPSVSILKATSSISKHGDVVTFREEGKEEFSFHTDISREYRELLKNIKDRSERLLGTIVDSISPSVSKEDELEDRVRRATHKCLDTIATCITKKNKKIKTTIADDHVQTQNRLQDKFITEKPQVHFKDKIENGRDTIFKPLLRKKPNSVVKLSFRKIQRDNVDSKTTNTLQAHLHSLGVASSSPRTNSSRFYYEHPYEVEINSFTTPSSQLVRVNDLKRPKPVSRDAIYVDTFEKLEKMNQDILNSSSVAVDLEHHSYRSFQGFTCLMQCTTLETNTDYIVDTIVLRSKMHTCNVWTTNSEILKVFHGADRDVLWLQRDFGIYIVNMFDTGQASRVLKFPSFALSHLLLKYCDVKAQKQYQLSDWRQRPLSKALRTYAQEDTHYLLYIAMKLRNELIDSSTWCNSSDLRLSHTNTNLYHSHHHLCTTRKIPRKARRSNTHTHSNITRTGTSKIDSVPNLLAETLRRSKEITLKRYEIPTFDSNAYSKVMLRTCSRLAPDAERVFAALFEWRDRVARELDESTGYVRSVRARSAQNFNNFSSSRFYCVTQNKKNISLSYTARKTARKKKSTFGYELNDDENSDTNARTQVLSSAAMAQLAEHMPINVGDVVSCLHPVPPIVRRRAVEIARIVETAKQRKRRPSELLAMSPDTVPIVQDNNSTSPSSSSHKIVEGDDWRVLRHLASECKMRHVSWSLEKNKEDDIIETAEHDVVGDLYVSNTSQDLDSLDSVRRELTEKIRSKSSRLWKALTRVDEEEEDVVEVEEEEEEEEEEKISTVPIISPAEALAQSILQERGEIKIDDVEEDKNDMIDGQLPKSILETYGQHAVRSGRRKRRNKTKKSKKKNKSSPPPPPPQEKKAFQPFNYDDLASKYGSSATSTLLLKGGSKRKREQQKKRGESNSKQQPKKPRKNNAAALLKPRKRMMTFSHQKKSNKKK